jgi:hypothetical protein
MEKCWLPLKTSQNGNDLKETIPESGTWLNPW